MYGPFVKTYYYEGQLQSPHKNSEACQSDKKEI